MNKSTKRVPLPIMRTAPINDAARILGTTIEDLRLRIDAGEAIGSWDGRTAAGWSA